MAKTIKDLKFDEHNFNDHTPEGMELLKKSVEQNGFGRSIVVDKNDNIIAGNGIVETATKLGKQKIKVIETTGEELVVVKRTDLDIDTTEGRQMAFADNAVAHANLQWNEDELEQARTEWDVKPEEWGIDFANIKEPKQAHEDTFNETIDNIPARVKAGTLWQLGEHRLLCSDSTKPETYEIIMNKEKASLLFTDPPYGTNTKAINAQRQRNSMY